MGIALIQKFKTQKETDVNISVNQITVFFWMALKLEAMLCQFCLDSFRHTIIMSAIKMTDSKKGYIKMGKFSQDHKKYSNEEIPAPIPTPKKNLKIKARISRLSQIR
jgi:hypothetical protein